MGNASGNSRSENNAQATETPVNAIQNTGLRSMTGAPRPDHATLRHRQIPRHGRMDLQQLERVGDVVADDAVHEPASGRRRGAITRQ